LVLVDLNIEAEKKAGASGYRSLIASAKAAG
jgi:hypothetical protein